MTVLNVQAGGHAFALKLKGEVWTDSRWSSWITSGRAWTFHGLKGFESIHTDGWYCILSAPVHPLAVLLVLVTTDTDSPSSIKERAAKKLHIDNTSDLSATYEWNLVRYALEDG